MTSLYVIGGQQRHNRSMRERDAYWYEYRKGLILRVDPGTGSVERCVEYVSPPEVCAEDDPAILFKSGTLQDGMLYASTQTEVMAYSVPEFELVRYLSLPCFNDVHHVRPTPEGNLLVAITGLDMVVEVTWDGEVLREWNTLGEEPWSRFSPDIDYRRVASTKPHRSHPNQVFYIGDDIWVTRFEQRDALCLTSPDRRIPIGIQLVHDGLVHDGRVYFTTVNGCVVIADVETLEIVECVDLNSLTEQDAHLGWCRGILVDGTKIWVGFSRLRLTKVRENLSWVRWGFKRHLPTRVACYDLEQRRCLTEIDLRAHGLDAVFSVFAAPNGDI